MGVSTEKVLKLAPTAKNFMKGYMRGVMPQVGSAFDFDINFDTIHADSVYLDGGLDLNDIFSKIVTIDSKVAVISAKTENLSVGSVDNMTVYYQNDGSAGGDEIVLVNRILSKIRAMWLQGIMGFGPLQDDISRKIWLDKPEDIHKAAQYAQAAHQNIKTIGENNGLAYSWLYDWYCPTGYVDGHSPRGMSFGGGYGGIHGLAILAAALLTNAEETQIVNPWVDATSPPLYAGNVYSWHGLCEAIKAIKGFETTLNAIKAKTDKIPDDLLTRLQSISTDASGANVKSGSAERAAKEAERVLKEEVKPKLEAVIKQVRASCAWVLDGCCRLVKAVFGPMKECFDISGGDQTRDSNTNLTPVYESPNFGITGNLEGENPPGYTFDCPALQRPWPYWPLSIDPNDRDETNFRSVVEDLPQAVAAYYWPSAYQGAEK